VSAHPHWGCRWRPRISSGPSSSPVLVASGSYHSLYPWHVAGCYARLESEYDRVMKGWMKHDQTRRALLGSGARTTPCLLPDLTDKYLLPKLAW
jgi:hypothetical protein